MEIAQRQGRRMAARLAGGALLALMGLSSPGQAFFAANMVAFQDVAGSAASVSLRDSALSPSGLAFNQRLRAIKGLADRDGAGILSFYSARDFRPAWTLDGKLTDAAKAVMARILAAEDEGLDPKAFAVPPLDLNESGPDAVIEAEIKRKPGSNYEDWRLKGSLESWRSYLQSLFKLDEPLNQSLLEIYSDPMSPLTATTDYRI